MSALVKRIIQMAKASKETAKVSQNKTMSAITAVFHVQGMREDRLGNIDMEAHPINLESVEEKHPVGGLMRLQLEKDSEAIKYFKPGMKMVVTFISEENIKDIQSVSEDKEAVKVPATDAEGDKDAAPQLDLNLDKDEKIS